MPEEDQSDCFSLGHDVEILLPTLGNSGTALLMCNTCHSMHWTDVPPNTQIALAQQAMWQTKSAYWH